MALWQDEVQVTEFVPEIALPQCFLVSDLEVGAPGKGLEHQQVRSAWFVQPCQQRVYSSDAATGRHYHLRPTFTGMRCSGFVGNGFQGAYYGCADRDDALTCLVCCIHEPRCFGWDAIVFFVGRLVFLKAGNAGV